MPDKHACCSYCGARFTHLQPWPRRCLQCGNTSYRNPLPVAAVLLPVTSGIVVIRRNTEPQKGTLTLPGGYIDYGETWQEAASRELREETGISLPADDLTLYDVRNGLDDTLVIFGLAKEQPDSVVRPFRSKETGDVEVIRGPDTLGFTTHTDMVARYFAERVALPRKSER